ncbi:hypothetical protein ACS0TY_024643 [Phlomoides rotata]
MAWTLVDRLPTKLSSSLNQFIAVHPGAQLDLGVLGVRHSSFVVLALCLSSFVILALRLSSLCSAPVYSTVYPLVYFIYQFYATAVLYDLLFSNSIGMESGGSSSLGLKNKGKKIDKTHRAWSPVEEGVLVELMKELVTKGWKTENGFKPGYLLKLESEMSKKIPGTDLLANPHITSRITIWKKFHCSLQTMLNGNSGIGFNPTTWLLDCHNDYWARIVMVDPNAANMCYKSWPLYEDWNEIFGTDRANGRAAKDVLDAVTGMCNEFNPNLGEHAVNPTPTPPDEVPVDMDVASETPGVDNSVAPKIAVKKRGVSDSMMAGRLCDVLGKFCKSFDDRIDSLVRVIGDDADIGNSRKDLFNVLGDIDDLTEDERIDVAHFFAKNVDCLQMFMGMAEGSRPRYVRRLLGGHINVTALGGHIKI